MTELDVFLSLILWITCASNGSCRSDERNYFADSFFVCVCVCVPRLQMRHNEMLKQNKDFKSTSSFMERKVDELTEENGVLSSQVTTHAFSFMLNATSLPVPSQVRRISLTVKQFLHPWELQHEQSFEMK